MNFILIIPYLFSLFTFSLNINNTCDSNTCDSLIAFNKEEDCLDTCDTLIDNFTSSPRSNEYSIGNYNTFDSIYETTNFAFYYESQLVDYDEVVDAGIFYEGIRSTFYSLGFNLPLLENGHTRFRVGLLTSIFGSAATYHDIIQNSNVAPSWIIHFSFSVANVKFKERATHEYFHAIQNAYNYDTGWFAEASANWAKIFINNSSNTCDDSIDDFIGNSSYLFDDSKVYGAVLFPLTIHIKCGGYIAIRRIYETWNNYSPGFSIAIFKQVVNASLQNTGYNESFDSLVRTMYSYITNSSYWFSGFGNSNEWNNASPTNRTILTSSVVQTYSGTIHSLSSKFITFTIPSNFKGSFRFTISFSGGDCWTQRIEKDFDGIDNIIFDGHNSITTNVHHVGKLIQNCELVLTNVSLTENSNFTINYSFYASDETISFMSSNRVIEKKIYLSANESTNINITFDNPGKKIIQTLSSSDTKIEFLSYNGVTLNNVNSCDDAGYSVNSFVTYNAISNNTYKIKVSFYSPYDYGYFRLVVTDSYRVIKTGHTSLDTFDDIWTIDSNDNYSFYSYVTLNKTQLLLYKPVTSGIHTISLVSTFDNYLYVFDPSSCELGLSGIDYDDDSGNGTNAQITRYLDANKTYLIIFCQYNPTTPLVDYDTGDDIAVHITM